MVSEGLQERVLCDGANVWHLYPELGLGAKRKLSRFHRAELVRLVPWYLPPAEDLARGADLKHVGEGTVAIVPRGAGAERREWRLVFAGDGRLAERRIVAMPENKVVYSETYSADGQVRSLDADGKLIAEYKYTVRPTTEPRLRPDKRDYVILPLPYRTREHVLNGRSVEADTRFNGWSEEDAMALLAADVAERSPEVLHIIDQRFFDIGDRRLGFFTLLLACEPAAIKIPRVPPQMQRPRFDPVHEHPGSPLAKYYAQHLEARAGRPAQPNSLGGPADSFLQKLANCEAAFVRFEAKNASAQDLLAYVRSANSPLLGWAMLSLVLDRSSEDPSVSRQIAEAAESFAHSPLLSYVARYEQARHLLKAGNWIQAQRLYRDLYTKTLQDGVLPPLDKDFRQAFNGAWLGTPQPAEEQWRMLMREAAATLIAKHARSAIIALAWQCRQLNEPAMAEELLTIALSGAPDDERLAVTLTAVRYHWDANELPRAESLLQALLTQEPYGSSAPLWRLAATLAERRGMSAQTVKCLDKALSIEFESMPDVVDLEAVRQEYGNLLNRCGQLADTLAALQPEPPRELLAVVVRAADRWRMLDSEATVPCQAAARILLRLNARDLAWDYLTTPMAMKPNESGPWLDLARLLREQGDNQLADRAFALAFAAEPTNAQILWERAELLQQAGRAEEAKAVYKQLAEGQWQPRFRGVQQQAKSIMEKK
jgi:tetratricopeptide (TPR) repeat protein